MHDSSPVRLNKYLAFHQGIARREADLLIEEGRVTVNGEFAQLGARVHSSDRVEVDGTAIQIRTDFTYLALHKPVGYVSSRRKQGEHETLYALLPETYHHLKPVGRLDKDSSGLLLLTDDGDFAHRMTHPSFHKTKLYVVTLDQELQPLHQQMISDFGVILEDGKSQFLIEKTEQEKSYTITMHEGRNRQIRRTFAALGYAVIELHRTQFGNYSLDDIAPGEHRIVIMR